MQVSIIIVNYNTKIMLKNCLESIYKHTKEVLFEVIVSDNGSSDGSIQMIKNNFPKVILLENNKNLGFGAANNKALKIAKGKYIFYLNSDTVLLNNAVKIFYDYWENSNNKNTLGSIGCNLLNEKMQIIHSYGKIPGYKIAFRELFIMFFLNIILSILYVLRITPKKKNLNSKLSNFIGKVDYITGADLFLLNDNFAKFDEYFLLYFEDCDLQFELQKKTNKDCLIIDGPLIQHLCGGSVGEQYTIKRKATFSRIQFEISRIKFLKKHYNSHFLLFIVKLFVTIIWLNPFLIKNTSKYMSTIWKI